MLHTLLLHTAAFFGGFAVVFLFAVILTFAHKLGGIGRGFTKLFCKSLGLDIAVSIFTWVPWVVAVATVSWWALPVVILGQVAGLLAWMQIHERLYWKELERKSPGNGTDPRTGPRIVTTLNRLVGRWQNHVALWVTAIALPAFLLIRLQQWLAYPFLVWLLKFPRYNHGEWVNVSRQKFDGLVGHDLVWCLYCDWMTGVYSLGAEMLRNVESFWCPIRFYDGKKCDNCKLDFPDITGGWVQPDAKMADVVTTLEAQYGTGDRSWFGHPVRLTVKGQAIPESPKVDSTGNSTAENI
jgi:hypothetical protein